MPIKSSYLLTRYPTLWNLKVHYVLPIGILLHLIFYALGRFSYVNISHLGRYYDLNLEPFIFFLSGVSSIIFLIIWLQAYFKNNALKLKQPQSFLYLRTQILWFIALFFLNSSFFISYIHGYNIKHKVVAQSIDFDSVVDNYNLGHYFLPFNIYHYDIGQSCDSVSVTDWNYSANQYDKGSSNYYRDHNIRYYCGIPFNKHLKNEEKELAHQLLRNRALEMVNNRDKEGIQKVIKQYINHVQMFGGSVKFPTERYTDSLIARDFVLYDDISTYSGGSTYMSILYPEEISVVEAYEEDEEDLDNNNFSGYYIENGFFEKGVQNTYSSLQYRYPNWGNLSPFFLIMLFLSLVILMFKLTSIRVGFISLISLGILFFVFSFLALLINKSAIDLAIVLLLFMGLMSMFFNKSWAGICATIFIWMTPFWHLLIISSDFFKSKSNTMLENIDTYNYIQIGITLCILIGVVVPYVLRWQSMPEE